MSSLTGTLETTAMSGEGSLTLISPYDAEELRATDILTNKAMRLLCNVSTGDSNQNTTEMSYAQPEMSTKVSHLEATQAYLGDLTKHVYAEAPSDEPGCFTPMDWKLPNDQHRIRGRLPVLIDSVDHDEPCSPYLKTPDIKPRRLHLPVFLKLNEITDLSGPEYIKAWLDCLLCHAALWGSNVHHRDINVGNLMYYRLGGKVYGVLNDHNLMDRQACTLGTEQTGTWPFMAVDMQLSSDENTPYIYDYDVESFLWCLLWTTHRYEDGVVSDRLEHVFNAWTPRNPEHAARNKHSFVMDLKFNPTSSHASSKLIIERLCQAIGKRAWEASDERVGLTPAEVAKLPPPPPLLPLLSSALKRSLSPDLKSLFIKLSEAPTLGIASGLFDVDSPAWTRLGKAASFGRLLV